MSVVVVVVAAWLIAASTLAVIMARRGHDPFVWWMLGALLGPLAYPLAIAHRSRSAGPLTASDRDESGKVLVALRPDGDVGDVDHTLSALAAVSGPLSVTLATALDADAPHSRAGLDAMERARRHLSEVADALVTRGLAVPPVPVRLLFGDPAVVLSEHTRDIGFSLLLVGCSSSRWRRITHGSTRDRLARHGAVPVLLAPTRRNDDARNHVSSP